MPIISLESQCPYCQHQLAIDEEQEEIQTCDHVVYCYLARNHEPFAEGNEEHRIQTSLMRNALDERAEDWLCDLIHDAGHPPDCDHFVDPSIGEGEDDDEWKGGVVYANHIDEFEKAAAPLWQEWLKRSRSP